MSVIRHTLAVIGFLALIYAALALWLLPWLDFGVAVAITASCVIGLELCRAVQIDQDKQRHPSNWRRSYKETP